MLRRLLTLDKVDDGFYWETVRQIQKRYKSKKRDPGSSGGPHPSEKAAMRADSLRSLC